MHDDITSLGLNPDATKLLRDIQKEFEGARFDKFQELLETAKKFIAKLPVCKAEDMSGWPACTHPGVWGPSEEYLKKNEHLRGYRAESDVYCDKHAECNFRGLEHPNLTELSHAKLVRWMFEYHTASRVRGYTPVPHSTEESLQAALKLCFEEHNIIEIPQFSGNDNYLCHNCKAYYVGPTSQILPDRTTESDEKRAERFVSQWGIGASRCEGIVEALIEEFRAVRGS